MKSALVLALVIVPIFALAGSVNVSVNPSYIWLFPNETRDLDFTFRNIDYGTFNASIYIRPFNKTLFQINGTRQVKVEIYNWGSGETHKLTLPFTATNLTRFGDKTDLLIDVYDDDKSEEILSEEFPVRVVEPEEISEYKVVSSINGTTNITLHLGFSDGRDESSLEASLGKNATIELFETRAELIGAPGVLVENHSSGLSLVLNTSGYVGEYKLRVYVNTTDGKYSLSKEIPIYLLYTLEIKNVTAIFRGEVNAEYPLTVPVKGGTIICVNGSVEYTGGFPLGSFGEDCSLVMDVNGSKWDLDLLKGKFYKCFSAPMENGNYTIKLTASGLNGLTANYSIPFQVSNLHEYKPINATQALKNIRISFSRNALEILNNNPMSILAGVTIQEPGDFHYLESPITSEVTLTPGEVVEIPVTFNAPPGKYVLEINLEMPMGNASKEIRIDVEPELENGKIVWKRYLGKGENKTKITIYVGNGHDQVIKGKLVETIPKSVVDNLSFLNPPRDILESARLCRRQPDYDSCIKDLAVSSLECGICENEDCWDSCINAYLNNPREKHMPVVFLRMPEILELDPKVSWDLQIPPGGYAEVSYIIEKNVKASQFGKPELVFNVSNNVNEENETSQGNNPEDLVVYTPPRKTNWAIIIVGIVVALIIVGLVVYKFKMESRVKETKSSENAEPESQSKEEGSA